MKRTKLFLAVVLLLAISFSLVACSNKVNLETESDAIKYVENYIEKNDKWEHIANKVGVSYSSAGTTEFYSSSYAQKEDGAWTVVLHGALPGSVFSYIATVTSAGQVTELGIVAGIAENIHKS